jgi:hypothetical protein
MITSLPDSIWRNTGRAACRPRQSFDCRAQSDVPSRTVYCCGDGDSGQKSMDWSASHILLVAVLRVKLRRTSAQNKTRHLGGFRSDSRMSAKICEGLSGGQGRNRTGVRGFAGRCMTTLPPGRVTWRVPHPRAETELICAFRKKQNLGGPRFLLYGLDGPRCGLHIPSQTMVRRDIRSGEPNVERETRLELATPTLARSCSTN